MKAALAIVLLPLVLSGCKEQGGTIAPTIEEAAIRAKLSGKEACFWLTANDDTEAWKYNGRYCLEFRGEVKGIQ